MYPMGEVVMARSYCGGSNNGGVTFILYLSLTFRIKSKLQKNYHI